MPLSSKAMRFALLALVFVSSTHSFAATQKLLQISTGVPFMRDVEFKAQADSGWLALNAITVLWLDGRERNISIPQLRQGYVFQTDPSDANSKWFSLQADADFSPASGGRVTLVFARQASIQDFRAFSFWISRPTQSGAFHTTTDVPQGGYLPFNRAEMSISLFRKRLDTVTLFDESGQVATVDTAQLPRHASYR